MLLETLGAEHHCPKEFPDNPGAVADRPTPSSSAPPIKQRFVDKRQEPRYPTMDAVEVCFLESDWKRVTGTILDVSRQGLRIEVPLPIGSGACLEIVLQNRAIIFGVTRYCRRVEVGYQVGVLIEDVYYAQPMVF